MNSFKPGDWIKSTKYTHLNPIQIESIYKSNTRPGILGLKSKGTVLYSDEVELWQPKVDEWVWSKGSYIQAFIFKWTSSHEQAGIINYVNYEPFIGQLPTSIKDQS